MGNLSSVISVVQPAASNPSPHPQNHEGQMAVHLASYGGHLAVLEILLKYGAKVNMIDTAGYTPLHYAVQEAFLLMIVQS